MATTPVLAPALPKSGAVSKGYNFASTWEQNVPLKEQQKAAIAALSYAVAERPFPPNRKKVQGRMEAWLFQRKFALEEAGAMDAVLVNTHQFYKWFAELESAMKSETEEKYRLYENTLQGSPIRCSGIDLDRVLQGFSGIRVNFPVTYLGLPLTMGKIRVVHLQSILDKVRHKLGGWQGKLMNPAGRRELVRSVLSAVPIYLLTSIRAPKKIIEDIDKARKDFYGQAMHSSRGENAKYHGPW